MRVKSLLFAIIMMIALMAQPVKADDSVKWSYEGTEELLEAHEYDYTDSVAMVPIDGPSSIYVEVKNVKVNRYPLKKIKISVVSTQSCEEASYYINEKGGKFTVYADRGPCQVFIEKIIDDSSLDPGDIFYDKVTADVKITVKSAKKLPFKPYGGRTRAVSANKALVSFYNQKSVYKHVFDPDDTFYYFQVADNSSFRNKVSYTRVSLQTTFKKLKPGTVYYVRCKMLLKEHRGDKTIASSNYSDTLTFKTRPE